MVFDNRKKKNQICFMIKKKKTMILTIEKSDLFFIRVKRMKKKILFFF